MVTLPNAAPREVITRATFYDDLTIVAFRDDEGALIELVLEPEGTGHYADLRLTPANARELVDELSRVVDVAVRAAWTPTIVADAREYLPGMTDEQIIERLERLYRRIGGFVFGVGGRLGRRAGRMLAVEVHVETVEGALALVDEHAEALSGIPQVADRFRELRTSLDDVKAMYADESEHHR